MLHGCALTRTLTAISLMSNHISLMANHATPLLFSCFLCCFLSGTATRDFQTAVSTRSKEAPSRSKEEDNKDVSVQLEEKDAKRAFHIGERNEGLHKGGSQKKAGLMDYQVN